MKIHKQTLNLKLELKWFGSILTWSLLNSAMLYYDMFSSNTKLVMVTSIKDSTPKAVSMLKLLLKSGKVAVKARIGPCTETSNAVLFC